MMGKFEQGSCYLRRAAYVLGMLALAKAHYAPMDMRSAYPALDIFGAFCFIWLAGLVWIDTRAAK